ncbi:type VI secretion system Vgr family protein [Paraburkholderia hayleyella]|uniref:type VI secretion system Vgr family protein n=1 Tax=Paraburkholderia hayleyella TaxID=2152889 RepID=UPI0012916554|nr:type VI secretion system Vgr family protein [Paraburkholderia hayleyella]
MKNYLDNCTVRVYRKPERTVEINGDALPRWTPPENCLLPEDEGSKPLLHVIDLEGEEGIGRLSRYAVLCRTDIAVTDPGRTTLNLDSIVGTQVTMEIDIPGRGEFIPGMPGDTGLGNRGFHVREITGIVTKADFVRQDDRSKVYRFIVEPVLAQATKGCNYRNFQNSTVVEVIEAVLAGYRVSVEWRIAGPLVIDHYPRRDLTVQFFESDFIFFQRLCESNGLFYWFEYRNGAHSIVIADTLGAFHRHGEAYEPLRFSNGDRIDEEHIDRLELASQQTEGKSTVVAHEYTRPRLGARAIPVRVEDRQPRDTAGADQEYYAYGNVSEPSQGAGGLNARPLDADAQARFAALVRMQSLRCVGLRARGHGDMRGLKAGFTFHLTDYPLVKANVEYLVVFTRLKITETDQASGTGQVFRCETDFEIQPVREYFRMPFDTPRPVAGVMRAIVTGPEGQEIWCDAYGRIKCQLVPDREGTFDHRSFIWIQPVQQWQGGQTGTAWVPRIGSEILVGHVNNDPDMPFLYGCVVNANNLPAWELPRNQWLSGIRSCMEGGSSSNHLALDDTHGQQQAQLASDHGKSSVSLGYNTRIDGNKGRQDARGEGFEVRTDLRGALRAMQGMLATTHGRANAEGKVTDMSETHTQLNEAHGIHEQLAKLAQQHCAQDVTGNQGDVTDAIKNANTALRGEGGDFPEFQNPDIAISSAASTHLSAQDSTHIASRNHTALTAGGNVAIAALKSLYASVRGGLSFFAAQAGIRLFAAKGKVEVQAQGDAMDLAALKDVTVSSTDGRIIIEAKQEVWIGAGGSFICINGSGITNATTGKIFEKCVKWSKTAPDSTLRPLKSFKPDYQAQYVLANAKSGLPMARHPYQLKLPDGRTLSGVTTDLGETVPVFTSASQPVQLQVAGPGKTPQTEAWHLVGGGNDIFSDYVDS